MQIQRGWSWRTRDMSNVGFSFFLLFFFGSRRARTDEPILTIYTLYDVSPRKSKRKQVRQSIPVFGD